MYGERIGFLTDYGLDDAFVAVCHGVIHRIAPGARVIDISHTIPPQDLRRGSRVLARAAPYLAPAVLVAVVDPGVGTARRAVAVAAGGCVLVGPDNGVLVAAAEALGGVRGAYELADAALFLHPVSETFHGRDVFAPVAAHLTLGVPVERLGPPLPPDGLVRLPRPRREVGAGRIGTEVASVDRFGNVQLAVNGEDLREAGLADADAVVVAASGASRRLPLRARFADVEAGAAVVLLDSDGRVSVAVNRGRGDALLGIGPGAAVELTGPAGTGGAAKAGDVRDRAAG